MHLLTQKSDNFFESSGCQTIQFFGTSISAFCTDLIYIGDKTLTMWNLDELRTTLAGSTVSFSARTDAYSTTWLGIDSVYATQTLPYASTGTPNVTYYANQISKGSPSCIDFANSTCSSLYDAFRGCWSQAFPPGPKNCYCAALADDDCDGL